MQRLRSRKSRLTTVGIRCADHATPSIRKSWHYFANKRRSLGRHSSLADQSHGVSFSFFIGSEVDGHAAKHGVKQKVDIEEMGEMKVRMWFVGTVTAVLLGAGGWRWFRAHNRIWRKSAGFLEYVKNITGLLEQHRNEIHGIRQEMDVLGSHIWPY
jgi:hypothetical protein